jgi:hypothetical protein
MKNMEQVTRKCKLCGTEVILNYSDLDELKNLYYKWAYTHECLGNKLPFECYERALEVQKKEINEYLEAICAAAKIIKE